jgi:Replication protein
MSIHTKLLAATEAHGARAACQLPLDLGLPGDVSAEGHPPAAGGRAGPGGPVGAVAGDPTTLSTPSPPCYNGNNCCGAGHGPKGRCEAEVVRRRQEQKYVLREVLRDCTKHEGFRTRLAGKLQPDGVRLGGCGTSIHGMSRIRVKAGTAFYSGVETCKSLLCPTCGPRIRGRYAEDFTRAISRWHDRGPDHEAWFIRLSAQNTLGLPLAEGRERVVKGFQRLTNRKAWRDLRERYGLHYVKTIEETYGVNGWNPHIQLVVATVHDDSGEVLHDLLMLLRRLWPDVMGRLGYHADPRYGIDVEPVTSASLGGYLAKESAWDIGDELAKGHVKVGKLGGRAYEQIVADFAESPGQRDMALIHEYHDALYGRRRFSWSAGFRDLLHLGPEPSDEDLAGDDEPPGQEPITDVAVISGSVLYTMLRRRQAAGLLAAAATGGYVAVATYVVRLGYSPECVWPPVPHLTARRWP